MTRKTMLIAGAAVLALTAPAAAQRDGDKGNRGERAERSERSERPQRAERQQARQAERVERRESRRAERPQRVERAERREIRRAERPQRVERAERREIRRAERPQRVERQRARQVERAERIERREIRRAERPQRVERLMERAERREIRRAERPRRIERQQVRQAERQQQRQFERDVRREARADRRELKQAARNDRQLFRTEQRVERNQRRFERFAERHDMRPMRELRRQQQRFDIGERIAATAFAPVPAIYGTRYVDTPDYYYRYDDDYGTVYRIDRDDHLVSALYPLFGGYSIGDPWPNMYRSSYVPYGYQSYYYDTPDYHYRYDGNAIYRIDAGTQLIAGIVALLLGQQFGVGQMLPATYNTYNVPLAYRANYYDTSDAWYRYGDGYIYEVDPYSRRIDARYPLYSDNYLIGQPWPVAYPGYNVPYGYRDLYYDTPQYHYRYANGGIYQVDPTTQLITALVALVSGQQFGIGQPMPVGYSTYNVPFAYRDRYYDTQDDYYRYANGYVYEIDADSGLIEDAYPIYA